MECSRCAHAAAVAAGVFSDRPFSETPCGSCPGPVEGPVRETIRYFEGVEEKCGAAAPQDAPRDDDLPVAVLADTLRLLLALPADALEVVRLRYAGLPFHAIALALHRRRKTVEMILYRTLEKHPVLVELMPRPAKMRARQKARERARATSRRAK